MKFPDDIADIINKKFKNKYKEWLKASVNDNDHAIEPLEINLDIPTEKQALYQPDGVRSWIKAWKTWQGRGELLWCERKWHTLGVQSVPEKLIITRPEDAVSWLGETINWPRIIERYKTMVMRWPSLIDILPKYFNFLNTSEEIEYYRLTDVLSWISANQSSALYPRQIPVSGIDSKWLESKKGIVSDLIQAITGLNESQEGDSNFYKICGLKQLPQLIRMRILDQKLKDKLGGLSDISAPLEEIALLGIKPSFVYIIENLQTALAFKDLSDSVVIMGLGYAVDILEHIPWLTSARCIYWGDIDTHGFAILNRARSYLPSLETIFMDKETLLSHKDLWVIEKTPHASFDLPLLTGKEQELFLALKKNTWGQKIRLEQERIRWDLAWETIQQINNVITSN